MMIGVMMKNGSGMMKKKKKKKKKNQHQQQKYPVTWERSQTMGKILLR